MFYLSIILIKKLNFKHFYRLALAKHALLLLFINCTT